jgi:hypothetical protein
LGIAQQLPEGSKATWERRECGKRCLLGGVPVLD